MKKIVQFLTLLLLTTAVYAQTDEVLVTIGDEKVYRSEFQKIYSKNHSQSATQEKESVEDYFELFLNFKLKVKEGKEQGKDKTKAFVNELKGYRAQLALPYLTDKKVNDKIINEAYERLQKEINASHILIKLKNKNNAKDKAFAKRKMQEIRGKLNSGVTTLKAAARVLEKELENKNQFEVYYEELGYFSALQMVYPFENAAYNTPVGKISEVTETSFGYHVVKVNDARVARPQIRAAHIMVKSNNKSTEAQKQEAIKKINEIYEKLEAGEKYSDLAKRYSDDRTSGKIGGVLQWYNSGQLEETFANTAYALEKGEYSKPIQTPFGWHIVKKIAVKSNPKFEQIKRDLTNRVAKDSRSEISKSSLIERLKKQNSLTQNDYNLRELYKLGDKDKGTLSVKNTNYSNYNKVLFSFQINDVKQTYSQSDFLKTSAYKRVGKKVNAQEVVKALYAQYLNDQVLKFEEANLEVKYPDFKASLKEYKEGILLFDLMDSKVWSKAMKDTAGLREYYNNNKNNYLWDRRVEANIYTCDNAEVAQKVRKLVAKKSKGKMTDEKILKKINKKSSLNLSVETKKYLKYENDNVDAVEWFKGITGKNYKEEGGGMSFVYINNVIEPTPKTLKESRGLVVTDYQNYLEQQWLKSLKAKYTVNVNKAVLSTIK